MEQERKTEVIAEYIITKAIEELEKEYGQEFAISIKSDYSTGNIFIKVHA